MGELVYRRWNREDVDAVTAFAVGALKPIVVDEPFHVDPAKVRNCVLTFATKWQEGHFQQACWKDRRVVAAAAMFVSEMPFFERREGCVFFCFANEPGTGYPIMKAMMEHAKADISIRRVHWLMNKGSDPRFEKVIRRRLGFTRAFDTLLYTKE